MNRIHRKVWNKSLGQMVVASELATSDSAGVHGDGGSATVGRRASVLAIGALLFGGIPALAFAQSVEVGGNEICLTLSPGLVSECAVAGSASATGVDAVA